MEISISCNVMFQDMDIQNGSHNPHVTWEPSEGKDCIQSVLSYFQLKPGSILVAYSWKVPLFITNLQSQSVHQAGEILNRREGERVNLSNQHQYLIRQVAVNRAPRQQNNLMEQFFTTKEKLSFASETGLGHFGHEKCTEENIILHFFYSRE